MKRQALNLTFLRGPIAMFDVESAGLHGEGFAVSLVLAENLKETWHATWACPIRAGMGIDGEIRWAKANVTLPPDTIHCELSLQVRNFFWQKWLEIKAQGYSLFSDVNWPVESNFLSACIADDTENRRWQGPYPLNDAEMFLGLGKPPSVRRPSHLPAHNPLADVRHSLRQLRHVVKRFP